MIGTMQREAMYQRLAKKLLDDGVIVVHSHETLHFGEDGDMRGADYCLDVRDMRDPQLTLFMCNHAHRSQLAAMTCKSRDWIRRRIAVLIEEGAVQP